MIISRMGAAGSIAMMERGGDRDCQLRPARPDASGNPLEAESWRFEMSARVWSGTIAERVREQENEPSDAHN